jgi:hypothetical protein
MKKWYNVEFAQSTKSMVQRVNDFWEWLYDNDIRHEVSAAGHDMVHFEIELSPGQVPVVNAALDRLVWFDSIKAVA